VLDQQALCVSCHRGFLSPAIGSPMFLFGMDEGGAHGASVYAGSFAEVLDAQPKQLCVDCHVRRGGEVSHRFAGGQTALAGGADDAAQLAAMQALLREAALIDLPVVWGPEGAVDPAALILEGGEEVSFDVIVRNEGAGHRFPGGLRDTQDTWIALELVDAEGQALAWAGQDYAEGEDPSAWRLRVGVLDGDGHPELLHQPQAFRAAGWDASVPPRDARAVRYTWTAPEDLRPEQLPIQVSLTLKHRRHVSELHVSACAEQKDRPDFDVSGIDACAPQPITDIAFASVSLGGEAVSGGADRARWERSRDHALALRHHVQERLGEAEPSIAELRAVAPDDEIRALSWWLEASLAAHQGRLDDALAAADQAEALIGPHPALDRARGDAYAQVWRWAEAADAYARVAAAAPNDTASWQDLAQAAGSAGQDERALKAAQRGLRNQPRDESLLRSQDLALRGLGAADPAAEAAWVYVRRPDDTSALRTACAQEVEGCAQWLRPLPTIALVVE
ncbi:MAG: hypothetical protein H6740_28970, partial [Alphaproteobacteria bacterium]|nr:hypothetical protein [Alphaproteobacteria bacterium]